MKKIVLGGGCFWCVDAVYRRVKGVESVFTGFAGGTFENPTYEQIHYIDTGHAEVIEVTYDEQVISLEKLLEVFWNVHNPTTLNRQGNDSGTEYRSAIYYSEESDLAIINKSIEQVAKQLWDDPIVTEVKPLDKFYKAEDNQQDFFSKNPALGYCQLIINPKVEKFETHFQDILK